MAEKTFYDEIIECLRLTRRNTPAVSVSDEVLKEFMTDVPVRPEPVPEPAPVPAESVMDAAPMAESLQS